MDFTVKKYIELIQHFQTSGYQFVPFEKYCRGVNGDRFVILRHDVDRKADHSLIIARIEQSLGVKASYYFRFGEWSGESETIRDIVSLGHEIGYHYEDLVISNGEKEKAIEHFKNQLMHFRTLYPVSTICAHGSPQSRYDSRAIWKHYDYHDFGIIGEPYFDVDFTKVFYLTDTGRRWDGFSVSLRDRIPGRQDEWMKKGWIYHSTDDIIAALKEGSFPNQLMLTTHPQRWTDNTIEWTKELLLQALKNVVKGTIVRFG